MMMISIIPTFDITSQAATLQQSQDKARGDKQESQDVTEGANLNGDGEDE